MCVKVLEKSLNFLFKKGFKPWITQLVSLILIHLLLDSAIHHLKNGDLVIVVGKVVKARSTGIQWQMQLDSLLYVHWINIYPVPGAIQHLNNRTQIASSHF